MLRCSRVLLRKKQLAMKNQVMMKLQKSKYLHENFIQTSELLLPLMVTHRLERASKKKNRRSQKKIHFCLIKFYWIALDCFLPSFHSFIHSFIGEAIHHQTHQKQQQQMMNFSPFQFAWLRKARQVDEDFFPKRKEKKVTRNKREIHHRDENRHRVWKGIK